MPVVLTIGPYKFFFYSNEGHPLKAPHIHVRGGGGEAKLSLTPPCEVLESAGYTSSNLRLIRNLAAENKEFLTGAYHEYFS
ncbi:MAG: DUF4160 domain-containing protein [Deltaproteobacteria bacterium]|jgi:hypothetical protein|nr:DUF4160 domain-containing protein [Deltaproteobacteria bacterium]